MAEAKRKRRRHALCHPACGWIDGMPIRQVPNGCPQCGHGPRWRDAALPAGATEGDGD